MKKIEIILGVDRNFLTPLKTLINSILLNNSNNFISINIMHNDFTDSDIEELEEIFNKYSNYVLNFYIISNKLFKMLPTHQHFKISTYFRILAPNVLKESKKILYLDTDMIVDGDLAELWDIDITDYSLAAVREESAWADKRLGLPKNKKYFNAGVLLLNAEKIRQEEKFEKVIEYLDQNKDSGELLYLDQDALNAILFDEWLEIDEKWNYHNVFVLSRKGKIENINMDDPVIIHYTGPTKPWHEENNNVLKFKYIKYEMLKKKKINGKNKTFIKFNFLNKFLKKLYFKIRQINFFVRLNHKLKKNKFFGGLYDKIKQKFSPPPQIINAFEGKVTTKKFSILESHMDFQIIKLRDHNSSFEIEGWVFKKGFSNRKTKKYLVIIDQLKNMKKIFLLNDFDYPDLNNIYYDGNDYSKSFFFNFIKKENLEKGKYELGFLLENEKDKVFKKTGIKLEV